jgi:hypothetical protein
MLLTRPASPCRSLSPTPKLGRGEDQTTSLRLLTERHDDLTGERTRVRNRFHGVLRDLVPGGAAVRLSADKATALGRAVHPSTRDECVSSRHCPRAGQRPASRRWADQGQRVFATRRCRCYRQHPVQRPRHRRRVAAEDPRSRRRCHPVPVRGLLRQLHRRLTAGHISLAC